MSHLHPSDPDRSTDTGRLNILLVQPDDPAESDLLIELVERRRALVAWERDLRHARQALASINFDVVVADEQLPDGNGLSLVADRANQLQRWATILLTACADPRRAQSAFQRGVDEVVDRAGGPGRLLAAIDSLGAPRAAQATGQRRGTSTCGGDAVTRRPAQATTRSVLDAVVGQSMPMQHLRANIQRIAPVPVDVMLIGETGTGKDLVLQQLHALSGRPGPLVAMNCGAIPDSLFESELFGHEAGAFTGAGKARIGKFEQAHQGTLFLDEIDSMPMNQQVKLLRVLETRRVDRVGGRSGPALDLRVVAASQGGLEARCKQGLFRHDLWHRLNVVTLELAPLRQRREDVAALWRFHVDDACRRYGADPAELPDADMAQLMAYNWPGNVRELKHAAERFVLGLKVLPDEAASATSPQGLQSQLALCERELIVATLHRHGQRMGPAAAELGISEKTLSRRMASYRLRVGAVLQ